MQKKVKKWIGIICIALIIGVISLITIRYMTSNPEKNQEKGLVLSDDAEVWNKDVEDKSEGKEGIKIPGYGDITMSAEKDTWKLTLLNPEGNPCYFQYSLEIAETGEEIYQSDLIEPGKAITEFAVKNVPDKGKQVCRYTIDGRQLIHDNVSVNQNLMYRLSIAQLYGRSIEYMDNRVSLYSAQKGKCAVTGYEFLSLDEIHCHHKVMKSKGGPDNYSNLVLILNDVHKLIHAVDNNVIQKYLNILQLNKKQIDKINQYRELVGNQPI